MQSSMESVSVENKAARSGCLSELGWFFSGAVLPIGSLSFYRKASRRKVGIAILFFIVFTLALSTLSTIAMGKSMAMMVGDIHSAYQTGQIPEITIRNGIAEVTGPQPYIVADEQTSSGGIFMAVDTTGQITSIDRSKYYQGILITRSELIVLNEGRLQTLPLSQLNALVGRDPLVIDGNTVSRAWAVFSAFILIVLFFLFFLWKTVVRLMFIALLAVVAWGIGTLIRPRIEFGPFLISGLYAIVPAVYAAQLLNRTGLSILGLETLFLLAFWALGLVASLAQEKFFSADIPVRLWTALLGLPMLIWFIVDTLITIPSPYGQIILWAIVLLTVFALVGLRLYYHLRELEKVPPAPDPGPAA